MSESCEVEERPAARRPWPVALLALLLLLQSAGFGIAAFVLLTLPASTTLWRVPVLEVGFPLSHVLGVLSALLALLALGTALGFLYVRPNAWLYAVIVQGLTLLSTLIVHFAGPRRYLGQRTWVDYLLYGAMLYAVFMAVYLNDSTVQDAFHTSAERRGLQKVR